MGKRLTKAQREAKQYAALRQRVADVCTGAAGYEFDTEEEFATAHVLSRIVPALKIIFGDDKNDYLWSPGNLDNYDKIDSITDFLWRNNIRS